MFAGGNTLLAVYCGDAAAGQIRGATRGDAPAAGSTLGWTWTPSSAAAPSNSAVLRTSAGWGADECNEMVEYDNSTLTERIIVAIVICHEN